jgi:hypothetical protein
MAWLRLYDDILADPKVLMLGPEVFQTWILYLCAYKKYGGNLPDNEQLAFLLRLTPDVLEKHIQRMATVRLVEMDGDIARPHNWDKFQYESDSSRSRMKKLRDKTNPGDVTEVDRHGDGHSPSHVTTSRRHGDGHVTVITVTPTPSHHRHNAVTVTPSETDTDTETESDVAAVAATRAAPPPPTRKQQQQQPEFLPFGDELDVQTLVSEAVEDIAQFWPILGNVPNAKRVWERHAVDAVEGPEEWCRKIRQTAMVHSVAHEQCRKSNQRHFIPTLEKWVQDRDYSRPAPRVLDSEQQPAKKSNLDIAKEMLGIQEKNHAH